MASPISTTGFVRCNFNTSGPYIGTDNGVAFTNERAQIFATIEASNTIYLFYTPIYDEWYASTSDQPSHYYENIDGPNGYAYSILMMIIERVFNGPNQSGWTVKWRSKKLIAQSTETTFWNTNDGYRVIDLDTLSSQEDYIAVLKANADSSGQKILTNNLKYPIIRQELVEESTLPNAGLPDEHRVSVLTDDVNGDGVPDDITSPLLFNRVVVGVDVPANTLQQTYTLDRTIVVTANGRDDLIVYAVFDDESIAEIPYDAGVGCDWVFTLPNPPLEFDSNVTDRITIRNGGALPNNVVALRFDYVDYVYFTRESNQDPWEPVEATDTVKSLWSFDQASSEDDKVYIRYQGRYPLNFAWFHFTPRLHLVDPAASNIVDMYIITRGYYLELRRWLEGRSNNQPVEPTPLELRNTYGALLDNKMISDTVILHPGKFKILFGSKAQAALQAKLVVIRPTTGGSLTDNEVKVRIVSAVRSFFNIEQWEFGETFYFSELSAAIHDALGPEINSVALVPVASTSQFGDLYQVQSRQDEIFIPDISTANIEIVQSYTPDNLRQ